MKRKILNTKHQQWIVPEINKKTNNKKANPVRFHATRKKVQNKKQKKRKNTQYTEQQHKLTKG